MKKVIITIAILTIAAFMVYLTKPTTALQQTNVQNALDSDNGATSRLEDSSSKTTNPVIPSIKCDQEALLAEIDALKVTRNEQILALSQKGMDPKELRELITTHVKDHVLANQIYNPATSKPDQELSPEQMAIEKLKQNKPLLEDLMLAIWSGDSDEILDKFVQGNLQPLESNSPLHKQYLLNIIAMGGNNQMASAIAKLYGNENPLDIEVASSIIQSVDDPKTLKQLLSRVKDLNSIAQNTGAIYGHSQPTSLIQLAIRNNKLEATKVLLELGVEANDQNRTTSLNYFLRSNPESGQVIAKLLDRGFTPQNASSAKHLAHSLQENHPELASRVTAIESQLTQAKATEFANLPQELKDIIETYDEQYKPLNNQYLNCIAQNDTQAPKIPEYQPIDKNKIEQTVDQLVAQKVDFQQIIATLSAVNKETVEYGYQYLSNLRNKNLVANQLDEMPSEVRSLIGYLRQEDWSGMVEFMKTANINAAWDISPGSMIAVMLEKNAPESAIAAMAKISDKNDTQLLGQALHNPELFQQVVNYGFNLNATDQNNKNLLYHAVKTNSVDKIELLISHGVSFQSDPYGYDALDMLLRKMNTDQSVYEKLNQLAFPVNAAHLDYSLYLKTYYPSRYQKIIEVMPNLEVTGTWEPKS